ncbi:hypothetical protein Hanom_Chr02g00114561 [Helianthus anomalus]
MWHPRKNHSHPDLSLHSSMTTTQISGRNFFQVGDDVTTCVSEASYVHSLQFSLCFTTCYCSTSY